jgi:hypothetical protein
MFLPNSIGQYGLSPNPIGQYGVPNEGEDVLLQVAEWDSQMDEIDKQQERLLNDQWRLLRTQIGSLMGALAEMRTDLAEVKRATSKEQLEFAIEQIHSSIDAHGQAHASIADRVSYLENFIGESADKHKALTGEQDTIKTTMEQRLEYLEGLIGDSAEKYGTALAEAMVKLNDLHKAVASCAQQEHHATLEERLAFVEKELGESADKNDKHKTSMEERMEFLETKLGDSAEKHAKEIEDAKAKLGDLHGAVAACAKQEHHATLEERLTFIEKELGESADKQDSHKTSMETRMEFLENKLGDSAEKHAKEIEDAKAQLGDLHEAISKTAKVDHASSLDERLAFLEGMVGDNADKHAKALKDHKDGFEEHKVSMETRLDYLEALIGDSADKHWKEIDAAKDKLGSMEAAVSKCAKTEHHDSLEARVAYLEKDLGDSVESHTGRLGSMEKQLMEFGISLDGKGHKSEIDKLEAVVLAGIEKRLSTVEEKHMQDFTKRLSDYESKHMRDYDQMKGKIGDIDKALRECANIEHYLGLDRKHGALKEEQASQADAAKSRMRDLTAKLDTQISSFQIFRNTIDDRFSQLEGNLADKMQGRDLMKDVEDRIRYMQEDQKRARDMLESSILEQIRLEHSTVNSQASQIKEQWDREVKARQAHQDNYNDLLGQERSSRAAETQQMEGRMKTFETSVFGELQRIWKEIGKETPAARPIIRPAYTTNEYVAPPVYTSVRSPSIMSPRVYPMAPGTLSGASVTTVPPQYSTVAVDVVQTGPLIGRQLSDGTFLPTTF